MLEIKKAPVGQTSGATTEYLNILPCRDYVYLMIEIKAISMAIEGGF